MKMKAIDSSGGSSSVVDPGSVLSAFAVYNKKVHGYSSYVEATNGPGQGKKKNKKKDKKAKTNGTVSEGGAGANTGISSVATPVQPGLTKNQKKNLRKKLKKEEQEKAKLASENSTGTESQATTVPPPKKKQAIQVSLSSPTKKQVMELRAPEKIVNKSPVDGDKPKPETVVQTGKKTRTQSKLATNADKPDKPKETEQGSTEERPSVSKLITSEPIHDSPAYGLDLFKWLIAPHSIPEFFSKAWEKSPLHIRRPGANYYYTWLVSSGKLDEILRKNVVKFGTNVDVTSYTNGKRETHNPEGRAHPAVVWDYYANGCSVRWSNPQAFVKPLWRLSAALQEYLGTFVGSNIYLTPGGTQGFAPHYDDIEAFVLQVEGKKHWKVYAPRSEDETLPSVSSPNFNASEIGEPILDIVLEEGDLLYFPRGFIHQAKAIEGVHSLHITLSAYQNNTMTDLIREYLPEALDTSFQSDVDFRSGLPTDFLSYMGLAHADTTNRAKQKKRAAFVKRVTNLTTKILTHSWDRAADRLGKKFIWDSLPPYLTSVEKAHTVHEDGEYLVKGKVINRTELTPDSEIKLVRQNCIRIVLEEGEPRVYYNTENSLEYHGEEAKYLEIPDEAGAGIDFLISSYPNFVKVEDLPISDSEGVKSQLTGDLWEKGLLITREPLEPIGIDGDDAEAGSELGEEEESEHESDREFIDDDEVSSSDGDSLISNPEAEESEEDAEFDLDSNMENDSEDLDSVVEHGDDSEDGEQVNNGLHVVGRKRKRGNFFDDEAEESEDTEIMSEEEEEIPMLVKINRKPAGNADGKKSNKKKK